MMKQVFSLIIFFAFSLSVFTSAHEAFSFHEESEISVQTEHSVGYTTVIKSSDCDDCEDDGCGHESEHCIHHCSGIHNLLPQNQSLTVSGPSAIDENKLWSYNIFYTSPVLDPALKPPLFS
jgi:hypothetical protein